VKKCKEKIVFAFLSVFVNDKKSHFSAKKVSNLNLVVCGL